MEADTVVLYCTAFKLYAMSAAKQSRSGTLNVNFKMSVMCPESGSQVWYSRIHEQRTRSMGQLVVRFRCK